MTTYSGDGRTALVGGGVVMMVDEDPSSELVRALWPSVAAGSAVGVLDTLLARGIGHLPDFALAARSGDGVSVWRRGAVAVTVVQRGAAVVVPAGSTTFAEAVYEAAERVELGSPATPADVPLVMGVVRAGFVVSDLAPVAMPHAAGPPASRTTTYAEPSGQAAPPAASPFAPPAPDTGRAPLAPSRPTQAWTGAELAGGPPPAAAPQGVLDGLPAHLSHPVGGSSAVVEMPRFVAPPQQGPGQHYGDTTPSGFGGTVVNAVLPSLASGVPAVRCPDGHLNDPGSYRCRVCQQVVPEQPAVEVTQLPPVGRLVRVDTGEHHVIELARTIVGRDPRGPADCALVRVGGSPTRVADIHLELIRTGFAVAAVDASGSGVVVANPGQQEVRIQRGVPEALHSGATVLLGDEVTYRFEAI